MTGSTGSIGSISSRPARGSRNLVPLSPQERGIASSSDQHARFTTKIFLRGAARHVVAVVYDPLSGKIAAGEAGLAAKGRI